jgi:hypothetical protein
MYGALIASLGAVTLMLAANETFARGGLASTHSISRPPVVRSFRDHHRDNARDNAGAFWPGEGDYSYGPSNGEPMAGVAQPTAGDIHATCTYDIPWDWVHRCPPALAPSARPYAPSCPAETVTVPGNDGVEQTVSITRCY